MVIDLRCLKLLDEDQFSSIRLYDLSLPTGSLEDTVLFLESIQEKSLSDISQHL